MLVKHFLKSILNNKNKFYTIGTDDHNAHNLSIKLSLTPLSFTQFYKKPLGC